MATIPGSDMALRKLGISQPAPHDEYATPEVPPAQGQQPLVVNINSLPTTSKAQEVASPAANLAPPPEEPVTAPDVVPVTGAPAARRAANANIAVDEANAAKDRLMDTTNAAMETNDNVARIKDEAANAQSNNMAQFDADQARREDEAEGEKAGIRQSVHDIEQGVIDHRSVGQKIGATLAHIALAMGSSVPGPGGALVASIGGAVENAINKDMINQQNAIDAKGKALPVRQKLLDDIQQGKRDGVDVFVRRRAMLGDTYANKLEAEADKLKNPQLKQAALDAAANIRQNARQGYENYLLTDEKLKKAGIATAQERQIYYLIAHAKTPEERASIAANFGKKGNEILSKIQGADKQVADINQTNASAASSLATAQKAAAEAKLGPETHAIAGRNTPAGKVDANIFKAAAEADAAKKSISGLYDRLIALRDVKTPQALQEYKSTQNMLVGQLGRAVGLDALQDAERKALISNIPKHTLEAASDAVPVDENGDLSLRPGNVLGAAWRTGKNLVTDEDALLRSQRDAAVQGLENKLSSYGYTPAQPVADGVPQVAPRPKSTVVRPR